MANRAFLQPTTVREPAQGDFRYLPVVRLYEAPTAAALEVLLSGQFLINQQSITEYWVIEDIKYAVVVTQEIDGMNPPELLYSALVWATKVEII
jgi:hypothetical protein